MKQVFVLFAILFLLAGGVFVAQKYLQTRDFSNLISTGTPSKIPTATINNHSFNLEITKTQQEKEIGLSAKKKLEQNAGMLFLFEKPGSYPFWMKNMKFPIDIIFIRNGRIVTIHKNVKPPKNSNENPPTYNSTEPANTVLEINADLSEKYNFKVGDVVRLEGT